MTVSAAAGANTDVRVRVLSNPILWMVAAAYACNYMDRNVVSTLAQAIKVDLHISDTLLGLLQGLAYVLLYSIAGIPIARAAEKFNRVNMMAICLVLWSGMTMVCGLAANFVMLFLFRVGVGIGEAGCNPLSHSIIADAFEPKARSRALSIYMLGATVGTSTGAMVAGVIAEKFGWRPAFFVVGVPGIVLAIAMKLWARDPVRTQPPPSAAQHVDATQFLAVVKRLVTTPALVNLIMGFTLCSFVGAAHGGFTQPYFIRAFGLTYGQIGFIFGLAGGVSSAVSLLVMGRLTDWASSRSDSWLGWLPVVGIVISAPCSLIAYTVAYWPVALVFSLAAGFFLSWFIIPCLAAFHRLTGARIVPTAMALILMFQNLVGLGGGPFFAGVLIDALGQHLFSGHGDYAVLCAGGVAHAGAGAAIAHTCHTVLTQATRLGLMLSVSVEAWALVHFAFAAGQVRRELSAMTRAA